MMRIFFFTMTLALLIFSTAFAAENVGHGRKIIYIPIDNRPVNLKQTVEVPHKLGYEILVPPENLLGTGATPDKFGKPLELWDWLNANASAADAAVISTDAMIYGSLVGSRQHELSAEEILSRAEKFKALREKFPYLQIYTFGTIMRTPRTGSGSGTEPAYYQQYGAAIFEYTALRDKSETDKLSAAEKAEFDRLESEIPAEYLDDWLNRRARNFNAHRYLVDLARAGTFEYFLVGCDDSAMFSQTHLESRYLTDYAKGIVKTKFNVMSGADELGMLMLSRAINDDTQHIPFVAVTYNVGTGGETIPTFSNEKISESIDGAIISIGGLRVSDPKNADLVVAVHTNPSGKTLKGDSSKNNRHAHTGIGSFVKIVKSYVKAGYPVGIADISASNGADNALMNRLKNDNLQFKIRGYGGWNTATNTSGFLIGSGVLTKWLDEHEIYELLLTRYFDDWAYQANVRTRINGGLIWTIPGEGGLWGLNEKKTGLEELTTQMIADFAAKNIRLPENFALENFAVRYPWSRTFEVDVHFNLKEK